MGFPRPLVLPRVEVRAFGKHTFSFSRQLRGGVALGSYSPGAPPVVYNVGPELGSPRSTLAVYAHESTHQNLLLNTSFGLLTRICGAIASQEASVACHEEQWSVQELDATFAELFAVATAFPDEFDETRRSLPSASLDQPPYRELFDSMSALLPIEAGLSHVVMYARYLTVHALASCAMSSDCLVQVAAHPEWDNQRLIQWIRLKSPVSRFELLVAELFRDAKLEGVVNEIVDKLKGTTYAAKDAAALRDSPFPDSDYFPLALEGVRRRVSITPIHNPSTLQGEAMAALSTLSGTPVPSAVPAPPEVEPLPDFLYSPAYLEKLRTDLARRASVEPLEALLALARQRRLGVWMTLSLKHSEEAWVSTQCYLLADPPNPIEGEPEPGTPPLPDRLTVIVATADLNAALTRFPEFPHIVCFIKGSWRHWNAIPGAKERLGRSVRVCVEPELSANHMRELLTFENLGKGAETFLIRHSKRGRTTGVFANRRVPGTYGLQRVPDDPGPQRFLHLAEQLGIPRLTDLSQLGGLTPHENLLWMIGFD